MQQNKSFKTRLYEASIVAKKIIRYHRIDMFSCARIEISKRCNRACPYCPNSMYNRQKSKEEMETETFKSVINQLSAIKYNGYIEFELYNEPLLDKRLPEFVKFTKDNLPDAWIDIYTNGDFLTEQMYNILVDNGADAFHVTKHCGAKIPIEDVIKRGGALSKVVCGDDNFPVLWNRCGLIKIDNPIHLRKCTSQMSLNIRYNGDVIICCNDYLGKAAFGNVKKESIMDIWDKKDYRKIRNDLQKGIFTLHVCKECAYEEAKK